MRAPGLYPGAHLSLLPLTGAEIDDDAAALDNDTNTEYFVRQSTPQILGTERRGTMHQPELEEALTTIARTQQAVRRAVLR
jgi:hypothetical protein